MMYRFSQSSSLSDTVTKLLEPPQQQQLSLHYELALCRATVQDLVDKYDEVGDLNSRIAIGVALREALEDVTKVAERASKIQTQTILTPATVALLATQIESIANEMFGGTPTVLEDFLSRIQAAMVGISIVDSQGDKRITLRPYETTQAMDAMVPDDDQATRYMDPTEVP